MKSKANPESILDEVEKSLTPTSPAERVLAAVESILSKVEMETKDEKQRTLPIRERTARAAGKAVEFHPERQAAVLGKPTPTSRAAAARVGAAAIEASDKALERRAAEYRREGPEATDAIIQRDSDTDAKYPPRDKVVEGKANKDASVGTADGMTTEGLAKWGAALAKEIKTSVKGIYSEIAGDPKLGYPAHMEGSSVMQTPSDQTAVVDQKQKPKDHEHPASDDHDQDSVNYQKPSKGERPTGWAQDTESFLAGAETRYNKGVRKSAACKCDHLPGAICKCGTCAHAEPDGDEVVIGVHEDPAVDGDESAASPVHTPVEKATAGRSMVGAGMGALAGGLAFGPLGAIAGGALGHHMQHGQGGGNMLGGSGGGAGEKKPSHASEVIGAYTKPVKEAHRDVAAAKGQKRANKIRERAFGPMPDKTKLPMAGATPTSQVPGAGPQKATGHSTDDQAMALRSTMRNRGTGLKGRKMGDSDLEKSDDLEVPEGAKPVFVMPGPGGLHLHEVHRKEADVHKGLLGMGGGGALGYLVGGPVGALAGGMLGDKLADDDDSDDDDNVMLVIPHEKKLHHYSVEAHDGPETMTGKDDSPMATEGAEAKGVLGGAAGGLLGWELGGPLGLLVGAYLGHKIQEQREGAEMHKQFYALGIQKWTPIVDDDVSEPAPGPEAKRKVQANSNIGGGLEQKDPDTAATAGDPHEGTIMASLKAKGLDDRMAHLGAMLMSGGRNFRKMYRTSCQECREFTAKSTRPDTYFQSLAKAIDTGLVSTAPLSPTDITRFHREYQALNQVLVQKNREV